MFRRRAGRIGQGNVVAAGQSVMGETMLIVLTDGIGEIRAGGAAAEETLSVIGPRATYREFAKKIGAQFLDVTNEEWSRPKNLEYLKGVVKRGGDVIFAGKYDAKVLDPKSVLADEIKYLLKNGYKWSSDFTRLIKF
jgi:hypothetical protein